MPIQLSIIPDKLFQEQQKAKVERRLKLETSKNLNFRKLSKQDIDFLVSELKRPVDHKNQKPFHFITLEKGDFVILFDGLNKVAEVFEKSEMELELEFWRKIRLFALEKFLKATEEGKNVNGGFLFN